ncbi:MAG: hypothetical protein ACREKS_12675, partial [Candidatus Rokuibacteriota bacterium]
MPRGAFEETKTSGYDGGDRRPHPHLAAWLGCLSRASHRSSLARIVLEEQGGCSLYRGSERDRGLTEQVFDPTLRVADLDRLGIERQVLS